MVIVMCIQPVFWILSCKLQIRISYSRPPVLDSEEYEAYKSMYADPYNVAFIVFYLLLKLLFNACIKKNIKLSVEPRDKF